MSTSACVAIARAFQSMNMRWMCCNNWTGLSTNPQVKSATCPCLVMWSQDGKIPFHDFCQFKIIKIKKTHTIVKIDFISSTLENINFIKGWQIPFNLFVTLGTLKGCQPFLHIRDGTVTFLVIWMACNLIILTDTELNWNLQKKWNDQYFYVIINIW